MQLNNLRPAEGSRRSNKRVGRGIGSGWGKTCARGHKGQKSRSGGFHKVGFEGGQMPLQRRLPKVGFISRKSATRAEVRLHELKRVSADVIDLKALIDAGIVASDTENVKVIASGEITKAVELKDISVTPGARKLIEAAGGNIQD